MRGKLPSIVFPEGIWTDALSDGQKDYAEALIDEFELRGLDTRDRDLARHAIYHALLFPAGSPPSTASAKHRSPSPTRLPIGASDTPTDTTKEKG